MTTTQSLTRSVITLFPLILYLLEFSSVRSPTLPFLYNVMVSAHDTFSSDTKNVSTFTQRPFPYPLTSSTFSVGWPDVTSLNFLSFGFCSLFASKVSGSIRLTIRSYNWVIHPIHNTESKCLLFKTLVSLYVSFTIFFLF